jgi:hypothetical protein
MATGALSDWCSCATVDMEKLNEVTDKASKHDFFTELENNLTASNTLLAAVEVNV